MSQLLKIEHDSGWEAWKAAYCYKNLVNRHSHRPLIFVKSIKLVDYVAMLLMTPP